MLIDIAWVFFRANSLSDAIQILKSIFNFNPWVLIDGSLLNMGFDQTEWVVLLLGIVVMLIVGLMQESGPRLRQALSRQELWFRWVIYLLGLGAVLLFGVYVLLNGHLSPGGGFSGGAILGAALILYAMAFGFEDIGRFMNEKSIKVITCCSLGFYVVAKSYSFITGANHLHSIISTGTPGAIVSAGLIMPLNVAVGFVVACTMYSIFSLLKRGSI